jgi:hypothetical protein
MAKSLVLIYRFIQSAQSADGLLVAGCSSLCVSPVFRNGASL